MLFFFFFSSRRRHTRCSRDWSSDVCSSDVQGLASTILARSARQLLQDWRKHYGYAPLLLETLVDGLRFKGTCYRAANWIYLGQTAGGTRTDRLQQPRPNTAKLLFVYPLLRRVQQRLCLIDPPSVLPSDED